MLYYKHLIARTLIFVKYHKNDLRIQKISNAGGRQRLRSHWLLKTVGAWKGTSFSPRRCC